MKNEDRQQAIDHENKLKEQNEKLDKIIDWLIDNAPDHPNWEKVVSEYHIVNNRIAILKQQKKEFSGIEEVSTISQLSR